MTLRRNRRTKRFLLCAALGMALSMSAPAEGLNLNTATVEQLESLRGLGKRRAQMIVRIREKNGPFRSIDELLALPRLTRKQFEQLKQRLFVDSHASRRREGKQDES